MPDAIITERLTKHYGSKCVVNQLSLRVPEGCVYGFLGRNGAGKSTTIKMLTGLVRPDFGRATLLGDDSVCLSPSTKQRVAYLAEGHPLYSWMTIGAAVNFMREFYPAWNQTLVDQILDHFQLERKKKIRHLSKGQQAQVSLALGVAPDPELLILDDPTLGLDTVVRRDFLESLIQIIQRRGRTIFISSHVLGDVERVADRIGVMVDGVLRVDCPTEQFKQSIRKVVAHFDGLPPAWPACEGVVGSRAVGRQLELVVVGFNDRHREALQSLKPAPRAIEVVELNLEDAFIEYTRGSRPPLPVFVGNEV
jgi:ABC-2 type transport system ATP-binding protein